MGSTPSDPAASGGATSYGNRTAHLDTSCLDTSCLDTGQWEASARRSSVASPDSPILVLAAGGLVVRPTGADRLEVAVVHRSGRCDWSFPKGKIEEGESLADCARREVMEETGFICRLVEPLARVSYLDRRERPKHVHYWVMEPQGGRFRPSDEVDELRWIDLDLVDAVLTYRSDMRLAELLRGQAGPPHSDGDASGRDGGRMAV